MRNKIIGAFEASWREQKETEPPLLTDDTVLLDTGLDSLGFAIIITRLEEELGYDPFSLAEDAFYPQTFREFVDFYETHRPAQ
ncbi:MAG: acyl carrier protein [Proteobacteria bacterium]|nr:acyl carrier protein [Pseudomonadota bacterium]